MGLLYEVFKAAVIIAFLYYGLSVLFANAMVKEFDRYGLPQFRKLVGILEVLGAVGLFVGYFVPGLVVVAAGGLTLLMVLGVGIRFRSGDSLGDALQALVMMLVNLFICLYALGIVGP